MRIELEINGIEPVSLNHAEQITAVRGAPRKYKTKAYQQFESLVNAQLNSQKSSFKKFNSSYDPKEHYIVAEYKFYYPILTKKKLISARSKDCDNLIKPIQDILFKHIEPDDSQIISVYAIKIHSDKPRIMITYTLRELKLLS